MAAAKQRGWPAFWLSGAHPFAPWDALLRALAALWRAASAWRWRWATPYHVGCAVICVGNFTLGGGGKTPLVMLLAQHLRAHRPAILSRGYGRRRRRMQRVHAQHALAEVGDEALMMAERLGERIAVYVGANRRVSARAAIQQGAGLLLMDDGMQNPALVHTLNLAVVDAAVGLGNGRVLPAGPLRRPWRLDLARADALLVMQGAEKRHPSLSLLLRGARARKVPIFPVQRRLLIPRLKADAPLYAFCGLARAEKFFAALRADGRQLVGAARFADHHAYTQREARRLLAEARARRAQLVTTAKDMARLRHGAGALRELAQRTLLCEDELVLRDRAGFWKFVRQRLRL